MEQSTHTQHESLIKRVARIIWVSVFKSLDKIMDSAEENAVIIKREVNLFLGAAFAIFGAFNFQSNKYCDGNAADYLSCTRPVTYYYYGVFEIALIILGAFLIMLWFLKRKHAR
jgi:hypothetical protein